MLFFEKWTVALLARAWIEIISPLITPSREHVALLARAWIEIPVTISKKHLLCWSLSLRERGLKFIYCQDKRH